jgi:hypothetical protein
MYSNQVLLATCDLMLEATFARRGYSLFALLVKQQPPKLQLTIKGD